MAVVVHDAQNMMRPFVKRKNVIVVVVMSMTIELRE